MRRHLNREEHQRSITNKLNSNSKNKIVLILNNIKKSDSSRRKKHLKWMFNSTTTGWILTLKQILSRLIFVVDNIMESIYTDYTHAMGNLNHSHAVGNYSKLFE